jgi:hypothetical protein
MTHALAVVSMLTDAELDGRLHRLVRGERQVLVLFLAHLGEFERRRAHEARSYPSAFEYCTKRLGLSEAEAFLRIRAARIVRDYPEAFEMLADGGIHLSGLARLSPHLSAANAARLLASARGKTRREVERLALEFEHGAPKADVVRALPAPGPADIPMPDPPEDQDCAARPLELLASEEPIPAASKIPEPGSQGGRLVRICFTATEELLSGIERARALLRHKHPTGRLEHVFGEAIAALLDARDPQRRLARKAARGRAMERGGGKGAAVPGARPSTAREGGGGKDARPSRRIPQRVRDAVLRRDGERCSFVAADGRRCEAVEWLEYDHIRPWALGGRSDDPANVRILCRAHNQHAARRIFGLRKD